MRSPAWISAAVMLIMTACGGSTDSTTATSQPLTTTLASTTVTSAPSQGPGWFAEHLAVGDCWNEPDHPDGEFDYSGVPDVVDCSVPHDNEVFAVFTPDGGEYPGEDGFEQIAQEVCDPEFSAYVGVDWSDAGALTYFWLYPDPGPWAEGIRGMACSAYLRDDAIAGSVAGIGTGTRPFDFPGDAPIPADALLIRTGLTDEGDRLALFEVETDPATTLEQILTAIDAVGWMVDASGGASRTVVLELSHEGADYTITITTPEDEAEPVRVAFYYPAGDS